MALTDAVARLAGSTGKSYTLNDIDGLSLLVIANGAKKWHFRFSLQGKQQRISLGSYPALSLKQTRQQRDELRAQLAAGNDPCNYRQQCNAAARGVCTINIAASSQVLPVEGAPLLHEIILR